jgi:hypothetical protein
MWVRAGVARRRVPVGARACVWGACTCGHSCVLVTHQGMRTRRGAGSCCLAWHAAAHSLSLTHTHACARTHTHTHTHTRTHAHTHLPVVEGQVHHELPHSIQQLQLVAPRAMRHAWRCEARWRRCIETRMRAHSRRSVRGRAAADTHAARLRRQHSDAAGATQATQAPPSPT